MAKLNPAQVAEVLAPSKRYAEAEYAKVIARAKKVKGFAEGNIEADFPGVKPAHVAHMLKQLRGDDKTLVVDTHATYGVCLIRVKPASADGPSA